LGYVTTLAPPVPTSRRVPAALLLDAASDGVEDVVGAGRVVRREVDRAVHLEDDVATVGHGHEVDAHEVPTHGGGSGAGETCSPPASG
jgi:hypothetical protein